MKSFAIIESGSTKADWAVVIDGEPNRFTTMGINPMTLAGLDQKFDTDQVALIKRCTTIYFYGAGTNTPAAQSKLKDFFFANFNVNSVLHIESDLLAACRALLGNEEGIVGIMGTGSNSCIYKNDQIVYQMPSLGYMLSDEGSGNHIGKELLKHYFYEEMDNNDKDLFESTYDVSRVSVLDALYRSDRVSAYLAAYSKFLNICSNNLKIKILEIVVSEFIKIRVKKLPEFNKFGIYLTGSIASSFETEIKAIFLQHAIPLTKVVARPIDQLIKYHQQREL